MNLTNCKSVKESFMTMENEDNCMEKCPICKISYMNFGIEYNYGNPVIYYHCPFCNYDTRNLTATTSNYIEYHSIKTNL